MRFYKDDPTKLTWVRWYFVADDAPFLPFPFSFGSLIWDRDNLPEPSIGEVYKPHPYSHGAPPYPVPTTGLCGSADQWKNGCLTTDPVPPLRPGTQVPICCGPPPGPIALSGGSASGGTLLATAPPVSYLGSNSNFLTTTLSCTTAAGSNVPAGTLVAVGVAFVGLDPPSSVTVTDSQGTTYIAGPTLGLTNYPMPYYTLLLFSGRTTTPSVGGIAVTAHSPALGSFMVCMTLFGNVSQNTIDGQSTKLGSTVIGVPSSYTIDTGTIAVSTTPEPCFAFWMAPFSNHSPYWNAVPPWPVATNTENNGSSTYALGVMSAPTPTIQIETALPPRVIPWGGIGVTFLP